MPIQWALLEKTNLQQFCHHFHRAPLFYVTRPCRLLTAFPGQFSSKKVEEGRPGSALLTSGFISEMVNARKKIRRGEVGDIQSLVAMRTSLTNWWTRLANSGGTTSFLYASVQTRKWTTWRLQSVCEYSIEAQHFFRRMSSFSSPSHEHSLAL